MTILQAFILGIVQGITEFLPISSSGHLILVPSLLGWEVQSLSFDIALHLGTLLAVALYFRRRLYTLLSSKKFLLVIIIGTIPAGVAGVVFGAIIEDLLRTPLVVAFNLIVVALIMFLVEKWAQQNKSVVEIGSKDAIVVGIFQMFALVPGVSRSGITIVGGLLRNLTVAEAAEFSFLLSLPVIAGAGVLHAVQLFSEGKLTHQDISLFSVGAITSAIVGVIVIRLLMSFLKSHSLRIFVIYRIILGLVILFLLR